VGATKPGSWCQQTKRAQEPLIDGESTTTLFIWWCKNLGKQLEEKSFDPNKWKKNIQYIEMAMSSKFL